MEKVYNFNDFEKRIDELWNTKKVFHAPIAQDHKSFVIVIPPPNVTGVLHMGHGLNNTIQDLLTRYHRMRGASKSYAALWVPGSDHAGIATQQVVERKLLEENITKQDLGREQFVERTWTLAKEHRSKIMQQLRRLGASCDWDRERFTLDEGLSNAVKEVFVSLYERGLIYRGNYLINWSVDAGTALSDDEVVHKEVKGTLYHINYPIVGKKDEYVTIATTRPETMFGDTAIAVHPEDKRYTHLIGKSAEIPISRKEIPIIADSYVDMSFGTGCLKVTPAHDYNDYEVGKRHDLAFVNILNLDGTLNNEVPDAYQGLKVKEARKKLVSALEAAELLKNTQDHIHNVGHCYRTDCVVEPLFSTQWFVKMDGMAQKALKALKDGDICFYPKHWENTYVHWLEHIRDWCISRQLWWGHRLPVWYDDETNEVIVSREDPTQDPKYQGRTLRQEEDVLDTWFSSWLWPFSVMGWPEDTEDLKHFYPSSTLVTAYDIIFFWVARMIMAGLEFTGKVPFKDIYIHGLVRDEKGRKMSKSLGNGIDPLNIIEKYGADALKFTLTFLCKLGGDVLLNEESFQLGSKFANKVWNASRFLLMNVEDVEYLPIDRLELKSVDKWIISKMSECIQDTEQAMFQYRLDEAAKRVYEYFWTDFCDWYVEFTKVSLHKKGSEEAIRTSQVLLWLLIENLKILHPFLPFISEEIYQQIASTTKLDTSALSPILAAESYPRAELLSSYKSDDGIQENFDLLQEIVVGIRTLRSEFNLSPKLMISCRVYLRQNEVENQKELKCFLEQHSEIIACLVKAENLRFVIGEMAKDDEGIGIEGSVFATSVDVKDFIDITQEVQRLEKKKEKLHQQYHAITQRLQNKDFIAKAKPEYIQSLEAEQLSLENKIGLVESFIEKLSN